MTEIGNTGEQGTFVVRILNRRNATWQGTITSVAGKEEWHFRSLLEMIKPIDSALASKEEAEEALSGQGGG